MLELINDKNIAPITRFKNEFSKILVIEQVHRYAMAAIRDNICSKEIDVCRVKKIHPIYIIYTIQYIIIECYTNDANESLKMNLETKFGNDNDVKTPQIKSCRKFAAAVIRDYIFAKNRDVIQESTKFVVQL